MSPRWQIEIEATAGEFLLHTNFTVDGQVVALFGPSGAGKSIFVEALCGIRPARGLITIDGNNLLEAGRSLPACARRVGWVPQDAALFPHLTVAQNLAFSGNGIDQKAVEVLGISNLLERMPALLSGGERQRVALARALCSKRLVLVLDEPLSAVDLPRRARVFRHLLDVRSEFGLPMLYVSHDPAEVLAIADEVVLLDEGRQLGVGSPRELLANASAMRFLDRLGFENVLAVELVEQAPPGHAVIVNTPGGCELVAPSPPSSRAKSTWLAVQADDVILANVEPRGLSARNIIAGKVSAIEESGNHLLVRVDCGDEWVATLTRRAVRELNLAPGSAVWVVIKTHSMHWLAD